MSENNEQGRLASTICKDCQGSNRHPSCSKGDCLCWCREPEKEASTIRTICSGCKKEINTLKDLHPEYEDDFMPVLITNCCDVGPKSLPIANKIRKCEVCNFDGCWNMSVRTDYDFCCIDVPAKYIKQSFRVWACSFCIEKYLEEFAN